MADKWCIPRSRREERRSYGCPRWIVVILPEKWMLPMRSHLTLAWRAGFCFNTRKETRTILSGLTRTGHTAQGWYRFQFSSFRAFLLGGDGRPLLFPRRPKAVFPPSSRFRWLAE